MSRPWRAYRSVLMVGISCINALIGLFTHSTYHIAVAVLFWLFADVPKEDT